MFYHESEEKLFVPFVVCLSRIQYRRSLHILILLRFGPKFKSSQRFCRRDSVVQSGGGCSSREEVRSGYTDLIEDPRLKGPQSRWFG